MRILYSIFVPIYFAAIRLAALWNAKARKWVAGRKSTWAILQQELEPGRPVIWMHCASAGELEQGKPVLESLRGAYPRHQLVVSFFSPSGYDAASSYEVADVKVYLPVDHPAKARRFIQLLQPELVIFIKYEFWYYHLRELARQRIPVLLVSGVFRPGQAFFQWYGGFYRKMLHCFRHLFVQDSHSLKLLAEIGIEHASVGGDTRFDRVQEIATDFIDIPLIASFCGQAPVLVAGSTWPGDEDLLASVQSKLIIAPHEINDSHLSALSRQFPGAGWFSRGETNGQVLIIDNVGMLSRLYKYGHIAYVGGGFTRDGVHNVLEPAVFGKPVIIGPEFSKYREAREMVECGAAFTVADAKELQEVLRLLENPDEYKKASEQAGAYIQQHTGATKACLEYIQANRLLTS